MTDLPTDVTVAAALGRAVGIYLLVWKGEVVYVGQSLNVFARIAWHSNNYGRIKRGLRPYQCTTGQLSSIMAFDQVKIRWCAEADLNRLEFEYIQHYTPKRNVQHKNERNPEAEATIYAMPEFKRIMEEAQAREVEKGKLKRRRLPTSVQLAERDFKRDRDQRVVVSLPRLKFMENAGNF